MHVAGGPCWLVAELSFGTLKHDVALWLPGFFPAWQVGSKSECSKTQEVEGSLGFLRPGFANSAVSFPLYSIAQAVTGFRFQGR